MNEPNFGPLQGVVRKCIRRRRSAKVMVIGGNFSGKTYSALRLALGLVGPGCFIAMVSAGEAAAEEHYADLATFYHLDAADPALIERAKAQHKGNRIKWDAGGADPRAVLVAIETMVQAVGPDGVVILDSASDLWDGVKARVDAITGGEKSKNGVAWQTLNPWLDAFWDVVETAPCHVILCVRSKTEAEVETVGGEKLAVHYPTVPELRERDRFRGDVRIYLDSLHRARFEGRVVALNGKSVPLLTPEVGGRIKVLLMGVEAGAVTTDYTNGGRINAVPDGHQRPEAPRDEDEDAEEQPAEEHDNRPLPPEVAPWDVWWAYDTAQGKDPEALKTLVPKHARNRAEKLNRFLAFMRNGQGKSIGRPGILKLAELTAEHVPTRTIEEMLGRLEVNEWSELGPDHLAGFVAALLRQREVEATAAQKAKG